MDCQSEVGTSMCTSVNDDDDNTQERGDLDITYAPSHEVKRIYNDLIESCRAFEEGLPTEESERILRKNITTGEALFRQMNSTMSHSFEESERMNRTGGKAVLGNTASEMYLAITHTKVCSGMLKQKARNVGVIASAFKLEDFLDSLVRSFGDEEGGYSVRVAAESLAQSFADASCTAPQFQCLIGAFDKDDVMKNTSAPEPKDRSTVRDRRKKDEDSDVTQSEVVNENMEQGPACQASDTPEGLAKDIIKTVKARYRENGVPQNILEVAYSSSVPEIVRRLFGVCFVVRDGHVGLTLREGSEDFERSTAVMLHPDKPPEKKQGHDEKRRNQTIVSFSAQFLKMLLAENQDKI